MFAVQPYIAERDVVSSENDGAMSSSREPCRVIGIAKNEDGELAYIVEYKRNGWYFLDTETCIKRCEPGDQL